MRKKNALAVFAITVISTMAISAVANAGCPNLAGRYIRGLANANYDLDYTYEITNGKNENGVMVYNVTQEQIQPKENKVLTSEEVTYVADGVKHSQDNEVIPGASSRIFCATFSDKLVVRATGFGVLHNDTEFYLDDNGNLVVDQGGVGTHSSVVTYKRMP